MEARTKSGRVVYLRFIDPQSGINCVQDIIGNCGDLPEVDEDGIYVFDDDVAEWWEDLLPRLENAEWAKYNFLRRVGDDEEIMAIFNYACGVDLEDLPGAIMTAIEEASAVLVETGKVVYKNEK